MKEFSKEATEQFIDNSIKLGLLPEDFRTKIEIDMVEEKQLKYQYHLLTWGGFYNKEHKEKHGFEEGDYIFDSLKEREEYINKLEEAKKLYPDARMLCLSTTEGYNCNVRTTLHRIVEYKGKEYYSNCDLGINYPYDAAQYYLEYKWYFGFNDYPLGDKFKYHDPREFEKVKIKAEWITGAFNYNAE